MATAAEGDVALIPFTTTSPALREWSRTSNDHANAWYVYCQCGRAHWIGMPRAFDFDIELKDAGYTRPESEHSCAWYTCKCGRTIEYASHNALHVDAKEVLTDCQRRAAYAFVGLFGALVIILFALGKF
jgi:hypothetical protein